MGHIEVAVSFVVYTLIVIGIGWWASRYTRGHDEDYFLAGRSLGPWVAALSASASSESGWVTLGLVGEAFEYGVSTFWIIPGCLGGYLFNWLVIGRFLRRESEARNALTLPDLLASIYHKIAPIIRILSVLTIFFFMMLYVGAQLTAAGKSLRAVFGMDYALGVLIGAGIILAYAVSGGFRAVCWTDALQAIMMAFALVVLPIALLAHLGGWGNVMEGLQSAQPLPGETGDVGSQLLSFHRGGAFLWSGVGLILGFLGIGLGYPGQPHVLIRFMAIRDEASLKTGGMVAFGWGILVYVGAIVMGLATRALHGTNPEFAQRLASTAATDGAQKWWENSLPVLAGDLLPGFLVGLVLAAILAAMASTADSQLLVAASAISHDFIGKVWGNRLSVRARGWVSRASVGVLGLMALLMASTEARGVFDFVLYAWAGLGSAFGPVLILTRFWKKTTGLGAIAGMITGLATTVIWSEVDVLKGAVYELVPAFVLACIAIVVVSLLTQWESRDEASSAASA